MSTTDLELFLENRKETLIQDLCELTDKDEKYVLSLIDDKVTQSLSFDDPDNTRLYNLWIGQLLLICEIENL